MIVSSTCRGVKIWNIQTGESEAVLEAHWDGVQGCAVSPDSSTVVSASFDSTLKLWNIDSGQCIRTLKGHKDDVNACAVAPDGSVIVSASDDKTLKIWKPELQWPCALNHQKKKKKRRVNSIPNFHRGKVLPFEPPYGMMEALPVFQRIDRTPVLMMDELPALKTMEMPGFIRRNTIPPLAMMEEEVSALRRMDQINRFPRMD